MLGRMPDADRSRDANLDHDRLCCSLVVLILSFGGTIERMLEYFAWTMLAIVFTFLHHCQCRLRSRSRTGG